MKKDFPGIYSYQEAVTFLDGATSLIFDKNLKMVKDGEHIYVLLDSLVIVRFSSDETIIIQNHSTYNAGMKRYLSYFVKEKIKQKEFQWYLGEQIFFSTMIFENGQWNRRV